MTSALLLHGQPGGAGDWDGVLAALDGRVAAIAIDRPGWHGAGRARGLAGNCTAAVATLNRAGIDRATVVGHSFGGAVAAWLAIHHPERVQALVLAAPAANVASLYEVDHWLAAPVVGPLASAAALSGLGAALTAVPLRQRLARGLGIDDRYLSAAGRRLLHPAAWRSFVVEQRALIRELPQLEQRLGEIAVPTVVVSGREDHVVPAESIRQLARQIPDTQVRLLDRAGHLLPIQNADALAEIIVEVATAAATGQVPSGPRAGRSPTMPTEVPQPTEPVTPAVPEAPIAPIDPDPGTPADPERPATVPPGEEPPTPVVPEPDPDSK